MKKLSNSTVKLHDSLSVQCCNMKKWKIGDLPLEIKYFSLLNRWKHVMETSHKIKLLCYTYKKYKRPSTWHSLWICLKMISHLISSFKYWYKIRGQPNILAMLRNYTLNEVWKHLFSFSNLNSEKMENTSVQSQKKY